MKRFIPILLSILFAGACTPAEKTEQHEDPAPRLRSLMEKEMGGSPYGVETSADGQITFSEKGNMFRKLSGVFKIQDDYLIMTLTNSFPDRHDYRTGLFKEVEGKWKSVLPYDLILGKVDTLIDLDADGEREMILCESTHFKSGQITEECYLHILKDSTFQKVGQPALISGTFASDAILTISYPGNEGKILIQVDVPEIQVANVRLTRYQSYFSWEPPNLTEQHFLTIKGADVWVRDAPGTGKVLLKLKEGDRGKLLTWEGQLEIIRGQANFWYQIEFNGTTGWVFGAQTNKENFEAPIATAATEDGLWRRFRELKNEKCDEWEKAASETETSGGCTVSEDGIIYFLGEPVHFDKSKSFAIVEEDQDSRMEIFSRSSLTLKGIAFFDKQSATAGAQVSYFNQVVYALKNHEGYTLYEGSSLDGRTNNFFQLGPDEYCFITYQHVKGSPMSSSHYFNVYYVNPQEGTVRRVLKQLGNFDSGEFINLNEGTIATDSIRIQYKTDTPPTLDLVEYKGKKTEDAFTRVDSVITTYSWDRTTKSFSKK